MSLFGDGLRAWLWQRLTALYIAVFILLALAGLWLAGELDYARWRALLAQPLVNVATILFVMALLVHAAVGLRDIMMDYVSALGLRFVLLWSAWFGLLALGVWAILVLVKVVEI